MAVIHNSRHRHLSSNRKLGAFARKMPSSAIIHAAYFAAGAVIGGGLATVVSSKKQQIPSSQTSISTVDSRTSGAIIPPIVDIGASGDARITKSLALSPVLKYGNPGAYHIECSWPWLDLTGSHGNFVGYRSYFRHLDT